MTSVGPSILKVVRFPQPVRLQVSHRAPFLQSKQNELVTAFAKPKKMLWLFCVNIRVALRRKDTVNFEICLDFRYFTSNHITVPEKGSNFSSQQNIARPIN